MMKLVSKIVNFAIFIAFWIVFYINISFCMEFGLSKTGHGIVVFIFSLIGVSAIYICALASAYYLLKKNYK